MKPKITLEKEQTAAWLCGDWIGSALCADIPDALATYFRPALAGLGARHRNSMVVTSTAPSDESRLGAR
ncbi:hypothetical protein BBAD15_g9639 [Beauveria bassiana D1-5]|uniref:Uncharacterized protein n=1 Tax=Beauveria bassiana D1-5 TaxID=1245745 RepID=A0A0A2VB34_BEABA|nr:hypothetical protein BBAD15_g9639 [Beauveria bassiana D1-5]